MIFASRSGIVERSSRAFPRVEEILFLRFCLSAASSYQDKGREFPRRNEMVNKFSFANQRPIYRVVASRCVAAINLNFTDL